MKRFVLALFLATALAGGVPGRPAERNPGIPLRAEGSVDAMGTAFSVVLYGEDRDRLQAVVAQALEEARRLDHLLSNYLPDSEWSEMNRTAAERPFPLSPELFDLLSSCVHYSQESEGSFDISVGPLMKLWGFYKGSGHLPHRSEVLGAMSLVGYRNIQLDPKTRSVRFAQKGVELDPGGVGKGYAVDRIVSVLRDNGIQSALISGGGSSIYALGAPPGQSGWTLNIKNPKHPDRTAASITLRDESLSTSGNYEKFFFAEGKLYSHIMDPRTGYPSQGTLSVSVVTPKTIDGEIWAKPYYILGRDWAARHKKKDFRIFFCEDRAGVPCAWLQ